MQHVLQILGALTLFAALFAVSIYIGLPAPSWDGIYRHLEMIGIAGLAVFIALMRVPFEGRRPFTYVPLEGSWWEFLVIGAASTALASLILLSMLAVIVVLPILVPFKLLDTFAKQVLLFADV